ALSATNGIIKRKLDQSISLVELFQIPSNTNKSSISFQSTGCIAGTIAQYSPTILLVRLLAILMSRLLITEIFSVKVEGLLFNRAAPVTMPSQDTVAPPPIYGNQVPKYPKEAFAGLVLPTGL